MRPLRLVIADGGLVARSDLLALVERSGFEVVGESPTWDDVVDLVQSRAADLVLVTGDADFASGVSKLGERLATLVVAPDASATKEYVASGAFAVLTPSAEPELFSSMALMAVARASDLRSARKEADDLRELLETRKVVERAKGVLMRRLGVSEEDAYRKMQKASQDENRKMREIAESILSAERLYEGQAPPSASAR